MECRLFDLFARSFVENERLALCTGTAALTATSVGELTTRGLPPFRLLRTPAVDFGIALSTDVSNQLLAQGL